MYYDLPLPVSLGICGGLAGLIAGEFNQIFPMWVGCATGSSLGCVMCIYMIIVPKPERGPVVVLTSQNIYITYGAGQEAGQPKDIPDANIVDAL